MTQEEAYERAISQFGEIMIKEVRDPILMGYLNQMEQELQQAKTEEETPIFGPLTEPQKQLLRNMVAYFTHEMLYLFLDVAVREQFFDLLVKVEGTEGINLREAGYEVSFDLKLEPYGWIENFSKYKEYSGTAYNDLVRPPEK